MKQSWTVIAAAALSGMALALAVVFSVAAMGWLPADAAIRSYLLAHPEILMDMTTRLQAKQEADADRARQQAIDKLGMKAFFDPKIAFITGPAHAKTTLVEFYDYDCPFCRASLPAMKKYYQAHKSDTRFALIEMPIPSLHGNSALVAARVSFAARRQPDKFMALHFALLGQDHPVDETTVLDVAQSVGLDMDKLKADMVRPEVDAMIVASHNLAAAAKIDGTPAFIIDGRSWEGQVDTKLLAKFTGKRA